MKCRTIGCTCQVAVVMCYTMPKYNDPALHTDEVCGDCLEGYSRRPALNILGVAVLDDGAQTTEFTPARSLSAVSSAG